MSTTSAHEHLEKVLKIYMDKLKYSLGLDYRNTDYTVNLVDGLRSRFIIDSGEIVSIKINTNAFFEATNQDAFRSENTPFKAADPKAARIFREDIERCLRVVPKMFNVLGNPPVAPSLEFNEEKRKFKKVKEPVYEHKFEREINYIDEYRCTAIHFATGTLVREVGASAEAARTRARATIIRLLLDETIFSRNEDAFLRIESHEDIIFDIMMEAKSLNKDEVIQLIAKLKEEYGIETI